MKILGLTGSIAMGKTTMAGFLRRAGIPVFDADAIVRDLTRPKGEAFAALAAAFPEAIRENRLDRQRLAEIVFADPEALKRLESLLHPFVRAAEARFRRHMRRQGRSRIALDIPLLFETGAERRCDFTLLVTAPAFLQAERALRRPGMTAARLAAIRARQMPEAQKRRLADLILPTGLGRRFAWAKLCRWLKAQGAR